MPNIKRTLNSIGRTVWNATPKGSGLEKRQATIQLCIRAEGPQVVRVALIFRGTGQRISSAEQDLYTSLAHLIHVYFQVRI